MVNVFPFRGYRFDKKKVDVSKAVSPPYDVISPEFREELYRRAEYNIVRVILGKDERNDSDAENKYTRASKTFESWIKNGFVAQDGRPCIYVYSQEFEIGGEKRERTGFIALVKLENFGKGILPHEFTLNGPKVGRRLLLEKTKANFGQIFSLYSDKKKEIAAIMERQKNKPPEYDFSDPEGIRHRLWLIDDEAVIENIAKKMKDRSLIIADGHHRYETSLEYSRDHPRDEGAKYIMMTLVGMEDGGLVILPTHRLVRDVPSFSKDRLVKNLKKNFMVEPVGPGGAAERSKREKMFGSMLDGSAKHSFGLYFGGGGYFTFSLRDKRAMGINAGGHSKAWSELDVSILHKLVLEDVFGIDTTKPGQQHHVEYVKDTQDAVEECLAKVRSGEFQAAFFMNPTRMSEVRVVAENGERMPQKSTFFYPKVYTGLVMYKF